MSSVCCGAGRLGFRQHDPGDGESGRPRKALNSFTQMLMLHPHIVNPRVFFPPGP